jgi:hypothetical protein
MCSNEPPRVAPVRARVASWLAVIAVVGAGTAVTLAKPYEAAPPIRSDGLGYHAWTRAVLENDFRFCQWRALHDVGAISVENPRHPGRCQNKYAPGLALLRLPVMALVASQEGDNLVPSEAENWASLVLGLLSLVLTCVLISATLALLAVRPLVSNTVTLAACFGTGLFHYATFDSSFTHAHSAALFAGLVFLGVRAAQRDSAPHPVLLAALCFFIALVRPPDLLPLLVMVAAWVAWRYKQVERPTRPAGVRPVLMSLLR